MVMLQLLQWIFRRVVLLPQESHLPEKEVVAKLPVTVLTVEIMDKSMEKCRVYGLENLVVDDTMQELHSEHSFHPFCIKPWLDEHSPCPICRHELKTDDHAYESWREQEKEAEEDMKKALQMYV